MSNWITDRRPTKADADSYGLVWITDNGKVVPCAYVGIVEGTAWMPIERPEPYVKSIRYIVKEFPELRQCDICHVIDGGLRVDTVATKIPTREAAERIAAIYEEVMP